MSLLHALRRGIVLLPAVIPLVVGTMPALAIDRGEFEAQRDAWLRNRDQLAETNVDLEQVDLAATEAAAAVARMNERLAGASDRLERLQVRLAAAEGRLARADSRNDIAVVRLGQEIRALGATEAALAEYRDELEVQVVAAYKYGGSSARFRGVIDAVLTSESVTDFTTAYEQLQTSTVNQQDLVDDVALLAERLYDQRAMVGALQRRTERAEETAETERRAVAALTSEQTTLVREIRADRRERRRLLLTLEAQQAEFMRQVAELEAQSDRLFEQLRQYQYMGGAPGSQDLLWPTDGTVTSGFGFRRHPILQTRRLHAGIDIPAATGQEIYAAADGVVLSAGPRGGYGNAVVLDHGDGLTTVYAHQSQVLVAAGDEVDAGDTLGLVGSTGQSTGPHLHFEVRRGGLPSDPLDWY